MTPLIWLIRKKNIEEPPLLSSNEGIFQTPSGRSFKLFDPLTSRPPPTTVLKMNISLDLGDADDVIYQ